MNGRVVSLIYFYLVSVVAIVLLMFGAYNGITFAVNSTQFEKYPLPWGGEDRCAYTMSPPMQVALAPSGTPQQSAEEKKAMEEQKNSCLRSLEMERKQNKVNNLKDALTFTLLGLILFGTHFPLALRRSKEK